MAELTMYEGFLLPVSDAATLKENRFRYNPDEDRFEGAIRTEVGVLNYHYHLYGNLSTDNYWQIAVIEENY